MTPAGPLAGEEEFARAVDNVRLMGWEPAIGAHVHARLGYLAGSDAERLADLNDAIRDPAVDGIWCARGGYGAMRLLDGVDYDALRRRPRALIGYSDITALHLAVRARCRVVTFHGPTARGVLTPFSRDSLARAVRMDGEPCGVWPAARVLRAGHAAGRLEGGNLALIVSLVGTPYEARLDGAILVLEDVHEPVYRIDRMLQQLRLTGALARLGGLVFGAFTERPESDIDGDRPLDDVLREAADAVNGPCLADVPVGHIEDQWTLPLGAAVVLDTEERTLAAAPDAAANATPGEGSGMAEARAPAPELPAREAVALHQRGEAVMYLDVREQYEWNLFRIPGAVHVPLEGVRERAAHTVPADKRVVVYCARGGRAAVAADALRELGYADVVSLEGGIMAWVNAGGMLEE